MGAFTRAQSNTSDEPLLSALVSMDRTMAAAGFTAQIRAAPPPLHTSFSLCYQCRRNYIKLVGKRRMQRLLFETSSLARATYWPCVLVPNLSFCFHPCTQGCLSCPRRHSSRRHAWHVYVQCLRHMLSFAIPLHTLSLYLGPYGMPNGIQRS